MDRLCIFCRYFYFLPGEKVDSDTTPGYDAEIYCSKGHWALDVLGDNTEIFRENLLKARACADYDEVIGGE